MNRSYNAPDGAECRRWVRSGRKRSPRPRTGPQNRSIAKRRPASRRRGVTLLEVMLSVAILGLSMAAIGELVRIGVTASLRARDLTRAQIYAESKMNELTAGLLPVQAIPATPYELDPAYVYQVDVQPGLQEGMLQAVVVVSKVDVSGAPSVSYELYRWVVDPESEALLESDAEAILDSSSQGTTSSDTGAGGTDGGL